MNKRIIQNDYLVDIDAKIKLNLKYTREWLIVLESATDDKVIESLSNILEKTIGKIERWVKTLEAECFTDEELKEQLSMMNFKK